MADHRYRAVGHIAVMDVALARFRRTPGVREILVEMPDESAAPDQMSTGITVRERGHVVRLVGEQSQRGDETFMALTAGDGAANEALAEELEDPVVRCTHQMHPGINADERVGG